jgi:hypothetical protein
MIDFCIIKFVMFSRLNEMKWTHRGQRIPEKQGLEMSLSKHQSVVKLFIAEITNSKEFSDLAGDKSIEIKKLMQSKLEEKVNIEQSISTHQKSSKKRVSLGGKKENDKIFIDNLERTLKGYLSGPEFHRFVINLPIDRICQAKTPDELKEVYQIVKTTRYF